MSLRALELDKEMKRPFSLYRLFSMFFPSTVYIIEKICEVDDGFEYASSIYRKASKGNSHRKRDKEFIEWLTIQTYDKIAFIASNSKMEIQPKEELIIRIVKFYENDYSKLIFWANKSIFSARNYDASAFINGSLPLIIYLDNE